MELNVLNVNEDDLINKKDKEIAKLISEIANLRDSIFWGNKAYDDQLIELQDKNKKLERELDQQRFNNKHNLSIDQKIADKILSLEQENQILIEELTSAQKLMENL